jgi:ATP-dependent RNA helicase DDX51/DBP6
MKIETLFPVQRQVIPVILNRNKDQPIYPNDLCILAPTGSGKTLTYVLPIITALRNRIRPCIKAIVLVPVGDLAEQVFTVFQAHVNDPSLDTLLDDEKKAPQSHQAQTNTPLRVALLSNKHPFAKEQASLISREHGDLCLYDIIVSTPGRLVDHLQKTRGFDVSQLSYLVVDECDRIVEEIKQNWLSVLMQAVVGQRRALMSNESVNVHSVVFEKERLVPLQKILLSATLTRNPEKLEQIKLFNPIYFKVGAEKLALQSKTDPASLKTLKTTEKAVAAVKVGADSVDVDKAAAAKQLSGNFELFIH